MASSVSSAERYCSVCDNSVKATEWCTECDEFLCFDCLKHHKTSKLFKKHTTITTERYEGLPEFVKTLSYVCNEHNEQLDSYCSKHSSPCCICCALTIHKECSGVVPLKHLISGAKTSPALSDLEESLKDLSSYIKKLKVDKEQNVEEIQMQKTKIRDEISQTRKKINAHLDKLESNLLERLNDLVSTSTFQMNKIILDLNGMNQKVLDISTDLLKIKKHASDLQTFLAVPHLTSVLLDEENEIFTLKSDCKLKGKKITIFSGLEQLITQIKSFPDVKVEIVERNIEYKKEKEKQAQITGAVKQRSISDISLKLFAEFNTKKGLAQTRYSSYQVVSGCCAVKCEQLLFTEYNSHRSIDRLVWTSLEGNFIRSIEGNEFPSNSLLDVTNIDDNTCAVSCNSFISLVDIKTGQIVATISMEIECYGITHNQRQIYFCTDKGIIKYEFDTDQIASLVVRQFKSYSYICCDGKSLFFTDSDNIVYCCDLNGTSLWQFEDTSLLQIPRGIVVDRNGFLYVVGEQSNNVIVLSQDGRAGKELYKFSNPRAMCYDKTEHRILVCDISDKAAWFQIDESN